MRERAAMSSSSRGAAAPRMPDSNVSHRAGLFGSSLGGAGVAQRGNGGGASAGSSAMAAALEEDNDRLTADLEAKVSALKFATQAIHDEVSEHNRMLSGMVSYYCYYWGRRRRRRSVWWCGGGGGGGGRVCGGVCCLKGKEEL